MNGAAVAVIVVHAPSNDIAALKPLMPEVLKTIPRARSWKGDERQPLMRRKLNPGMLKATMSAS